VTEVRFDETVMTLGMAAVAAYFTVMTVRAVARYRRFRALKPTALLVWSPPRNLWGPYLVGLGFLAAALSVILWQRPFLHFYSQAAMAFYFVFVVPLLTRIPLGLYRDGVWAEGGFVRWGEIGRLGVFEQPEIVLVVVRRSDGIGLRLRVPAADYGAVRRLLRDQAQAGALQLEPGLAS
jgi:hypothetical protein